MSTAQQPIVNIVAGDRKIRLGVQMMKRYQHAIEAEVKPHLEEAKASVDKEHITRLAWRTLGQEERYVKLHSLEKECRKIEEELALFNGGRCSFGSNHYSSNYRYSSYSGGSAFDDAARAAKDMLYPEIKKLEKLLESTKHRVTYCSSPDELEKLRDTVRAEVKEILRED